MLGIGFSFLSDLFSLGKVTRGIISAQESIEEASRLQNYYYFQERRNREIGEFNARIAVETGEKQARAILEQTKGVYSQQMAQYGRSGLEYDVGSSQEIVSTETLSRGLQAAQEAMYNAEIEGIEERVRGEQAMFHSRQQAISAGYAKKRARDTLTDNIFKLGQTAIAKVASESSGSSLMSLLSANSESGRF
jgi:hypothetical protein